MPKTDWRPLAYWAIFVGCVTPLICLLVTWGMLLYQAPVFMLNHVPGLLGTLLAIWIEGTLLALIFPLIHFVWWVVTTLGRKLARPHGAYVYASEGKYTPIENKS